MEAPVRITVNRQYPTNMGVHSVGRNGRVFVPARYVAEALGATVDWDQENRTVMIISLLAQPPVAARNGRASVSLETARDSVCMS